MQNAQLSDYNSLSYHIQHQFYCKGYKKMQLYNKKLYIWLCEVLLTKEIRYKLCSTGTVVYVYIE